MNRNIVLELILIVSVASIWISGAVATQQYMNTYNTTFSTNGTCNICHVSPAGGGTLNSYGMNFQNQTNHADVAGGGTRTALITIGQAPVTTPGATTTATSTAKATSTATTRATVTSTATLISTVPPFNATPAPTKTLIPVETTYAVTTPVSTSTPSTPGFELGIFAAGLLACYFILKRRDNN